MSSRTTEDSVVISEIASLRSQRHIYSCHPEFGSPSEGMPSASRVTQTAPHKTMHCGVEQWTENECKKEGLSAFNIF